MLFLYREEAEEKTVGDPKPSSQDCIKNTFRILTIVWPENVRTWKYLGIMI